MFNVFQPRGICKYNLRGACRFGNQCWHIHEEPERAVQEPESNVSQSAPEEDLTQGACALSPSKPKEEKPTSFQNIYGPSTSSVEEAISLVKISESEEKICGICFDNIMKKDNRADQTFGILPNCNHCYCFTCLRKWRKSKEYESGVAKSCPECRIVSDFVYPSKTWMTSKEEKDTFIDTEKKKMKQRDCTYFRKGKGKCPFGNTCLYLHALPNGKVMDVGPPRPRRPQGAAGSRRSHLQVVLAESQVQVQRILSTLGSPPTILTRGHRQSRERRNFIIGVDPVQVESMQVDSIVRSMDDVLHEFAIMMSLLDRIESRL